jgi:elongation factor G
MALQPASSGDEDKMSTALARIAEEDAALRLVRDPETNQLVASVYGPTHMAVVQSRLQRKFGVSVETVPVRIAYRETVRGSAEGVGKHVKQSGGHGQYGIAHIRVAAAERGAGFTFHDKIVGGVIPRQFIGSVEKGVVDAMANGVLAGYRVVDVEVTVHDGKHHSVDSSDMAFQMAGALGFRTAAEAAGLVLLEPIDEVRITVPDALTGDVMGDLSSRRGRIQGRAGALRGGPAQPDEWLRRAGGQPEPLRAGARPHCRPHHRRGGRRGLSDPDRHGRSGITLVARPCGRRSVRPRAWHAPTPRRMRHRRARPPGTPQ